MRPVGQAGPGATGDDGRGVGRVETRRLVRSAAIVRARQPGEQPGRRTARRVSGPVGAGRTVRWRLLSALAVTSVCRTRHGDARRAPDDCAADWGTEGVPAFRTPGQTSEAWTASRAGRVEAVRRRVSDGPSGPVGVSTVEGARARPAARSSPVRTTALQGRQQADGALRSGFAADGRRAAEAEDDVDLHVLVQLVPRGGGDVDLGEDAEGVRGQGRTERASPPLQANSERRATREPPQERRPTVFTPGTGRAAPGVRGSARRPRRSSGLLRRRSRTAADPWR